MYVDWWDCETGAPCIDPKRPYGNSYVPGDIANIINGGKASDPDVELNEDQEETLLRLHRETEVALQIVLVTGKFEIGNYVKRNTWDATSWEKVS